MIIFSPAIDMLIFLSVFYALLYVLYARIYAKDIIGIYRVDIKITALLFVLAFLVYGGTEVSQDFFGYEINWFWIFVLLSTALESLMFLVYKRVFKLDLNKLTKQKK